MFGRNTTEQVAVKKTQPIGRMPIFAQGPLEQYEAMAKEMGFELQKKKKDGPDVPKPDDQVTAFLRDNGINVKVERSPYGQAYYNYKDRLNNTRRHDDKSDGHKHNMAMRYMVKRFLVDLHIAWRTAEGLPVSVEYSEGKLGMKHRQAA